MENFRKELNFRDLGGYPTKDGKVIRKGLVYRSASPGFMNEEEFNRFKQMHFHTILDLRSEKEITIHPYPDIEGTNKLIKSGLVSKQGKEIDFSPKGMRKSGEAGRQQLQKLHEHYNEIVFGNASFKRMFEELLAKHVPFLFHCATGKDRTGVAAILFLFALGVEEDIVKKDYLLSNHYRKDILEETLQDIDQNNNPEMHELMLMFDGVSENTFEIIMDSIFEKYETWSEFFAQEYDLDEKRIAQLKNTFLI